MAGCTADPGIDHVAVFASYHEGFILMDANRSQGHMRTVIHYLAALGLLIIYGGQVCPLIDTLTLEHWGALVLGTFVVMLAIRGLFMSRFVEAAPMYSQPLRQFLFEFALFGCAGLLLALYNTLHLGFPIHESGPKVVIGFLTFGYFIGLDLALSRELGNGKTIIKENLTPPEADRYTSLTRRFAGFALSTVFLTGAVLILAITKDVYWLSGVDMATDGAKAQLLILFEIGFILLTLSAYTLTIIMAYTRNIRFFFGNETTALRRVQDGDLDVRAHPLSRDEFGEIAAHTNVMIEGLRERERIKNVFGKAVSPSIARRLMEQEKKGVSLGGSTHTLVILFCDIRDFTSYTEANPPDRVIKDLNLWFTEAVDAIRQHGGIVDKFIGDGMLAVFGLDGDVDACANAVRCARDMTRRLDALGPKLCAPMQAGIGIHKGEVLAGIVGSPQRLEFTVIGDVVNTAARIEGLTRPLNAAILISHTVMEDLDGTGLQNGWTDYGSHSLKGKKATVELFGVPNRELMNSA